LSALVVMKCAKVLTQLLTIWLLYDISLFCGFSILMFVSANALANKN